MSIDIVINNNTFQCSIELLSNNSNYFKTMIHNFTEGNNLNKIILKDIMIDIDNDIIQNVLHYFQTLDNMFIEEKYCLYYAYELAEYTSSDKIKIKLLEYINDLHINNLHVNNDMSRLNNLLDLILLSEYDDIKLDKTFEKINILDIDYFYNKFKKIEEELIDNNKEHLLMKFNKYIYNKVIENHKVKLLNLYDYNNYLIYKKPSEKDFIINNKYKLKENDKTIVSYSEFLLNFRILTNNLIGKDFDWTDIIFSGGGLYNCISPNFKLQNNDVDLWIKNKEKLEYFVNYLKSKTDKKMYYYNIGSVTNIYINDTNVNFQLICANFNNISDIINNFDMDYLQIGYNGKELLCNYKCIESLKYHTIFEFKSNNLVKNRLNKPLNNYMFNISNKIDTKQDNDKKKYDKLFIPNDNMSFDIINLVCKALYPNNSGILYDNTDEFIKKFKYIPFNYKQDAYNIIYNVNNNFIGMETIDNIKVDDVEKTNRFNKEFKIILNNVKCQYHMYEYSNYIYSNDNNLRLCLDKITTKLKSSNKLNMQDTSKRFHHYPSVIQCNSKDTKITDVLKGSDYFYCNIVVSIKGIACRKILNKNQSYIIKKIEKMTINKIEKMTANKIENSIDNN